MVSSNKCWVLQRSHPVITRLKRAHAQSPGSPGRGGRLHSTLWNLFLSKLALHLLSVSVNSARCETAFSQMGLTHTKLHNRLGHAKTTQIVQVRQQLHRDRPPRTKSQVVDPLHSGNSGEQAAKPAASSAQTKAAAASIS